MARVWILLRRGRTRCWPRWRRPTRAGRAGAAARGPRRRRGDTAAERARLEEVLSRNPRTARARAAGRAGRARPAEACSSRPRPSTSSGGAAPTWMPVRLGRSVVKLVDSAILHVWPDGSRETLTQDLYRVRDLKGCEQLGELRLAGEVLRVATIKPDGTEFEPVPVSGAYVMPSLEPGDSSSP